MSKRMTCFPSVRVGQVIRKLQGPDRELAKVRTQNMRLDRNLLMYFPSKRDKWCVDTHNTRIGDIVVLKNLDTRLSKMVFTQIDSIMYKVGATVDPVTGRRCRGTDFLDDKKSEKQTDKNSKKQTVENKDQSGSILSNQTDDTPVKETEV